MYYGNSVSPGEQSVVIIRELVDSLRRDDTDTPIVRVHTKAF